MSFFFFFTYLFRIHTSLSSLQVDTDSFVSQVIQAAAAAVKIE
jgi:hypothetical protein